LRPRGEIRDALVAAYSQVGAASWREVLPHVPVNSGSPAEVTLVRRTVENMARKGELVRCGEEKPAGSTVWLAVYELAAPAEDLPQPWGGIEALAEVVNLWPNK
jgi:hypothetical protein